MQSATHVKTVFLGFFALEICAKSGLTGRGHLEMQMLFLFLLSDSGDDSSEKEERESPAEEEEKEEENMMPNTAREKEKNKRNELQVLCRKPSQLFSLLLPPPQI